MSAQLDSVVSAALDLLDFPYEVVECEPELADTAAFCEHYGYELDESANTIVVASKNEPKTYVACLVLATSRLDVNNVVRKKMGVRKASFAPMEEAAALTGMAIGGVTVFGLPAHVPLWIDAGVMQLERVILGGGNRSSKILISPEVFALTPNTEIVHGLARDAPGHAG